MGMDCDLKELDKITYELSKKIFAEVTCGIEIPITSTQLYMLYYIRAADECKVTDIANYLGVTLGAVTSLVDRLCEFGFVERKRNENDRRQVIIKLNKGGEDFLKKVDLNRKKIFAQYLEGMDQEEVSYFNSVVKRVITKILNS